MDITKLIVQLFFASISNVFSLAKGYRQHQEECLKLAGKGLSPATYEEYLHHSTLNNYDTAHVGGNYELCRFYSIYAKGILGSWDAYIHSDRYQHKRYFWITEKYHHVHWEHCLLRSRVHVFLLNPAAVETQEAVAFFGNFADPNSTSAGWLRDWWVPLSVLYV